jgi:hypothetical protein
MNCVGPLERGGHRLRILAPAYPLQPALNRPLGSDLRNCVSGSILVCQWPTVARTSGFSGYNATSGAIVGATPARPPG